MARDVIPEWRGQKLKYLSPSQSLNKFGYRGPGARPDLLPLEKKYFEDISARVPFQDGPVAPERVAYPSPEAAAAAIKEKARELGAGMVGITRLDQKWVYEDFAVPHAYAIVIAIPMDLEEILQVPRPESNQEYIRVYDACGRVATELAMFIRSQGYPARSHTSRRQEVAMLPLAYEAGLGELGKHGSLINSAYGSIFRTSVVTTDLPLAVDAPVSEGVEDFCAKCQMCLTHCPGDAISSEKVLVRGVEKWVVETEKCAPYFSTYYACAICLQVCPWNARAFGGRFKQAYVRTMQALNPQKEARKARLRAGAEVPWTLIPRPAEQPAQR